MPLIAPSFCGEWVGDNNLTAFQSNFITMVWLLSIIQPAHIVIINTRFVIWWTAIIVLIPASLSLFRSDALENINDAATRVLTLYCAAAAHQSYGNQSPLRLHRFGFQKPFGPPSLSQSLWLENEHSSLSRHFGGKLRPRNDGNLTSASCPRLIKQRFQISHSSA